MNKKKKKMKTKNNEKKSLRKTISYLFFFIILIFSNCNKDDTQPNCGCDSETKAIINESTQLIGAITYKEQTQSNSYYTNRYWITITDSSCSNCAQHMIVCNEDLITNEILSILNSQTSLNVKFSGELKEVCEKRFDISNISYQLLTLTKIELQ
ncbi:hypothetical protein BTO16_01220 [Polaribacter glomeratus]|uniref:Uncharacterized protein n=2 Tax=Polaribacter glomeratus TaxID=102 RepID=A0A2S7WZA6_9FLAO|nr:hypothetical protein BTO16_01220 [Polaribacter glomeratus]